MFFDINKSLCETFTGLDPIKLLDYPAEDVFELINNLVDYNGRNNKEQSRQKDSSRIRRPAGDDWF